MAAVTAPQPLSRLRLPRPSPVTRMKMLQHKHHATSQHRAASLTGIRPSFGFRGTSALG